MGNNARIEMSLAERNALAVSYEALGARVELDVGFVKKYLVRGKADLVSDQEIILFMNTCRQQGLNPLVQGEAYLIKWSDADPAQILVGKNAYLRRAFEHPSYINKSDGITVRRGDEIVQKEGTCLYPGEELVGGWCKVAFGRGGAERHAYKEVALSEYNRGMANWKTKPATMINKVAISQCVREAFPKEYAGLYSEEEMPAPDGAYPDGMATIRDGQVGEDDDPEITQEQRQQMMAAAKSRYGDAWKEHLVNAMEEYGMTSSANMTASVWGAIMGGILAPDEPGGGPEGNGGGQTQLWG